MILSFCKLHNLAYIYNLYYISVTAAPTLLWLLEILQFQRAGAPVILVLSCLLGPSSLLNIFHSSSFSFHSKNYCLSAVRGFLSHPVEFQPSSIHLHSSPFFPLVQSQLSCVLVLLSSFVSAADFISTLTSCAKVINKNI